MEFYVNGEKTIINKEPFDHGSEGVLYLLEDRVYKIYFNNALNEGFGNKEKYHKALLGLNGLTSHIILPTNLIFSVTGKYSGYTSPLVGDCDKNKVGLIKLEWNEIITNIKNIEKDSVFLGNERFYLSDFAFHNMVFSNLERKLYVVDPGRYHHVSTFTLPDYKRINKVIVNEAFLNLLRREIIEFKLITPGKISLLVRTIKSEIGELAYSDYLELQSSKYKTMSDFVKMKARYLK